MSVLFSQSVALDSIIHQNKKERPYGALKYFLSQGDYAVGANNLGGENITIPLMSECHRFPLFNRAFKGDSCQAGAIS